MQTVVTTAELFFLHHVRTSAASAVGKHHTCAGQGCCIYLDGATYIGMVLQSTLALLEQFVRALITPLVMVLESTLALAEEVARAWITPLELAACLVAPLT